MSEQVRSPSRARAQSRPQERDQAPVEAAAAARTGPYLVGTQARWARDWALIGLASGALAPLGLVLVFTSEFVGLALGAGLVGALVGGAIGWFAPPVLERVRGRVPIPLLLGLGLPIGAVWGALSGAAGSLLIIGPSELETALVFAFFAGVAGAIQLGATWFPYTFQSVLQRRTWPVVLLACLAAPLLGWVSLLAVLVASVLM